MAVTDAKGNVVEQYNYTPYGELIKGEYREDIPFLYNGQYGVTTDSNGLYYMRARYYNVEIKRFINQDVLLGVLERISSLNRYAYVEGNPISYLDPFGLERTDTYEWHKLATVLSIAGVVVKKIGTVTVQPMLITAGEILSIAGGAIDAAVYFIDVINDIKAGNVLNAVQHMSNLIISIIGVVITGTAVSYRAEAKMAANFNGISAGWENAAILKYDLWDNFYGTIQTASAFVVQMIQTLLDK